MGGETAREAYLGLETSEILWNRLCKIHLHGSIAAKVKKERNNKLYTDGTGALLIYLTTVIIHHQCAGGSMVKGGKQYIYD